MTDIIEGDLIEAMARAMCMRPERIDPDAASMGQDGKIRPAVANRMIELRAALAAAAERGYAVVPVEPTKEVVAAIHKEFKAEEDERRLLFMGIWWRGHRAMIAAGRAG